MNNKKTLIIIILAFVLLLGGAFVLYTHLGSDIAPDQLAAQQTPQQDAAAEAGDSENTGETDSGPKPAADFVVFDMDGNEVRLSDYIGKPIVLNFWASWCGPCQEEMPDFHEKFLEMDDEIHFLMVNMTDGSRETTESALQFVADNEYAFPVFFDSQTNAATAYGVYSLPTTFFIDAEGYGIAMATGTIDAETLQRGIDMITT